MLDRRNDLIRRRTTFSRPLVGVGVKHDRRRHFWPSRIHLQRRNERFLRNVNLAVLPHLLFAFLLLVEQFSFTRGVAAVVAA